MTPAQKKAAALALATAIAIPAEGLYTRWYADIATPSIATVCWGHTGDVDKTKTYSLAECKALLNKDMLYAIETVDKCQPGLPVNVLAAFSDASFNLGTDIACNKRKSTAARLLAVGDYAAACRQLPRWSKARLMGVMVDLPGLVKRRAAEANLCLKDLP